MTADHSLGALAVSVGAIFGGLGLRRSLQLGEATLAVSQAFQLGLCPSSHLSHCYDHFASEWVGAQQATAAALIPYCMASHLEFDEQLYTILS